MFTHNVAVPVGQVAQVLATGRYVRYVAVTAGATNPAIKIKTDKRDEVVLMPGRAVSLPDKFSELNITNVSGVASITAELMVGEGSMDDDRVTGEVLMLDGSYSRSVQQVAYVTNHNTGPTAAQSTQLQLWNPLGSGKLLVCHTLRLRASVAGNHVLRIQDHNAAFGTLIGQAKSRYLGATPSGTLGEVRATANAAIFGTELEYQFVNDIGVTLEFKDPYIIPPGRGLCAACATVNVGLAGSFDHFWIPST